MSNRSTPKLQDSLAYAPHALDADRAAAFACISRSKFLDLVDAREAPQPVDVGGCPRWLRRDLECWLDALSSYSKRPSRKTTLADLLGKDNGNLEDQVRQ
jgi:predicted DNA-binding transcriptional regulator AlpA